MDTRIHIITLNGRRHQLFLEQRRKDVYTQEPFRDGDRVVACGGNDGKCDAVYLADSYSAQGFKCFNCGSQELTLQELRQPQQIHFYTPTILDFRVNPKTIIPGETVMISWKVDKAEAIWLNEVVVSGETQINDTPLRPTKYVLKARNSKGWARERVEEVRFNSVRARLFAEPEVVVPGQSTYLRWEVENATNVVLDNGLGATTDIKSGRMEISPRKDVRYTLIASNGFEEVQSSVFVRLPEVAILNFNAEHDIVVNGTTVLLSWEARNAERVEITGVGEVTGSSYEYNVIETDDFELELTVYGMYDEKLSRRRIALKVARIDSFEIEQYGSAAQRQYRLAWTSHYLENLSLESGLGNVTGRSVSIPASDEEITYTLTGETRFGQKVSHSLELRPARIHSFDAFPIYAFIGMKGKLQWEVTNAKRLEIDKGIGTVSGSEHSFIFSEQHARLTLTAFGEINVATRTFELKIARPPAIVSVKVPISEVNVKLSIPRIGLNSELLAKGLGIVNRPTLQFPKGERKLAVKLPTIKGLVNPESLKQSRLILRGNFANKKFEVWKQLLQRLKEKILNHISNGQQQHQHQ